jgi:hypothetical protein
VEGSLEDQYLIAEGRARGVKVVALPLERNPQGPCERMHVTAKA